ncbi:hypothetical protein DW738_08860 [Streptococcus sp. AM28-20]|nr:hypothetical protein DW738_08860 [Streptococcus sp. AM28-20]
MVSIKISIPKYYIENFRKYSALYKFGQKNFNKKKYSLVKISDIIKKLKTLDIKEITLFKGRNK